MIRSVAYRTPLWPSNTLPTELSVSVLTGCSLYAEVSQPHNLTNPVSHILPSLHTPCKGLAPSKSCKCSLKIHRWNKTCHFLFLTLSNNSLIVLCCCLNTSLLSLVCTCLWMSGFLSKTLLYPSFLHSFLSLKTAWLYCSVSLIVGLSECDGTRWNWKKGSVSNPC